MRIHYHIPPAFVGGGERHVQYLIEALRRRDEARALSILVTYESDAIASFVASLDALRARVTTPGELVALLSDFRPDVIQFYASPLVHRALGGLRHDPRVIEVLHNAAHVPGGSWSYPKDRVHALVCVSPHVRLYAWLHAPDAPVVVIPNGVDPARFRPDPGARAATPVVGFAGRLSRDKGIDTILELAPRISCAIELVGRDFRGYRNARIPNVAVLPETDRPEDYYRRWWAFLSASPREGFGLAIAEALSSGCPPVMLRSGGITAYLRHGRDALIADSPADLVRHVDDVVEKRVALEPAAFRFSADDMARRYLELYRGPGPGRRPVRGPRAPTFRVRSDRPRVPGGALGVAPAGWYGVVRALAGLCDAHAEPDVAIDAIDAHRPRLVVLGCFQDEWIPVCRHAHRRGATVVATWHAAYVLNEFDEVNRRRMAALLDAYRAGDVDHLATPHRALAASWTHYGFPTDYLPNLVDQGLRRQDKLPGINIGILGSGQSWKNLECQIVAAGMIPGATIHVQSRQGLPVVARLGLSVRRHLATLSDERYHALVGGMTVNLCVSLSESYSYLTAESFLMETPVLTSSSAPLVRAAGADESLVNLCGTPHFDDPVAIADGITRLIERRDVLGPRLREHMLAVDRANREICARVVRGWQSRSHV